MGLQQLRIFVTIAAEGNLTRASRRLFLSQPAMSAQVKALEDDLGFPLFDRTARGMRLTARGQELLADAHHVLAAARALTDHALRLRGEIAGRFRLGSATDAEALKLGQLVADLSARFPRLELTLARGTSPELIDRLDRGELDAAFVFYDPSRRPASGFRVQRVEVFIAIPAKRIPAGGGVALGALFEEPWVLSPPGSCCRCLAEALFEHEGGHATPRFVQADTEGTARTLIASGVGVGLLHAPNARAAEAEGSVTLLEREGLEVDLWFAVALGSESEPRVRAVASATRAMWQLESSDIT
jgi:DNA-binding transcriptional LysR family regulator